MIHPTISSALTLLSRAQTIWKAFFAGCGERNDRGHPAVGQHDITNNDSATTARKVMAMYYMAMAGLLPFVNMQAGELAQGIATWFATGFGGPICLVHLLILQVSFNRLRRKAPLADYAAANS